MKKAFLKVAFISLMTATIPAALVGCKDYDDDIASLNNKIDGLQTEFNNKLEKQEAALKAQADALSAATAELEAEAKAAAEAAEAAANAAAAAQKTGDDALAAAQAANAEAELAKQAAADAKAEAIAEATRLVQELQSEISGKIADLQDELGDKYSELKDEIDGQAAQFDAKISALNGLITGIDSRVGVLESWKVTVNDHITTFNQFKSSVETQLLTLNNFMTNCNTRLGKIDDDISDIKDELDEIRGLITDNADAIEANSGLITALQGTVAEQADAISAIDGRLSAIESKIVKINGNLSTLSLTNSRRLTSVTLVPQSYVDGIPTIEFYTAKYKTLGKYDKATGLYDPAAADAKEIEKTNDFTKVLYRLNPAGVTTSDIKADEVGFVQTIATARSAEAGSVIAVSKVEKNDEGLLAVYATKNADDNIDNAGAGKIYTVALRVPIAEERYYTWTDADGNTITEDAADAVVYSEYSRIAETEFTPEIAATDKVNAPAGTAGVYHFSTYAEISSTTTVADAVIEVPYNAEKFNLNDYVTGCMNSNRGHLLMDAEQLKSFGFTLEYAMSVQDYVLDNVNQQEYATVTADGLLTPKNSDSEKTASATVRVGKTPIVGVVMKDAEGKAIDQRFFKVEFVLGDDKKEFDLELFTKDIACEGFEAAVDWNMLTAQVINEKALGFPMSKDEFVANYSLKEEVAGVTVDLAATGTAKPITWAVSLDDMAEALANNDNKVTKELVFTAPLFPDITVNLIGTFNEPTLPTLGTTYPAYWKNGVMQILPEAMPQGYNKNSGITVGYKTNVLSGRNAPYLNNLMECANWDIQFAAVPKAFTIAAATLPAMTGTDGYTVKMGNDNAATIWYGKQNYNPFDLTADEASAESTLTEMLFHIEENAAGIALVEGELDKNGNYVKPYSVDLGWYIYLNGTEGKNLCPIAKGTTLEILRPLNHVNTGTIQAVTQSPVEQTRDLAKNLKVADAFWKSNNDYFSKGSDKWAWYGITQIEWSNAITVTDTDGGNETTLAKLNMSGWVSEAGVLSFTGSGIALQNPLVLHIPVTVHHKWGKLKSSVQVTINPAGL